MSKIYNCLFTNAYGLMFPISLPHCFQELIACKHRKNEILKNNLVLLDLMQCRTFGCEIWTETPKQRG